MNDGKININLQLGEHRISASIELKQEEWYRDATRLLNTRFKYYADIMPKTSSELIWVYVALEMATNYKSISAKKSLEPIDEKLKELNKKIEQITK